MRTLSFVLISIFWVNGKIFSQTCPQANSGSDVSICPAGGSVTIGTPAIPGYQYSWNPIAGLNNPNLAQPTASPTQTTTYTVTMSPLNNLLQNGNFEQGNTGFSSDYLLHPNALELGTFGRYAITTNPSSIGSWCNMSNHTAGGFLMFVADGSQDITKRMWFENVSIFPNTTYTFSGFAYSIGEPWLFGFPNCPTTCGNPILDIRINGTPIITNLTIVYQNCTNGWASFQAAWNSGTNTNALIEIRSSAGTRGGNDITLDDLSFTTESCQVTTDQVTVCVCSPPPPPETVTVQIPLYSSISMTKSGIADGHFCYDSRLTYHRHEQYSTICGGELMSGFMKADNNQNSYQAFDLYFRMRPRLNNNSTTISYLDFIQNNTNTYEACLESDIIGAKIKLFHKQATYPICDRTDFRLSEYNLQGSHSGANSFTVKRSTNPSLYKNSSCRENAQNINFDNPPPTASEVIIVPASSTLSDDYIIDVTQMVKNSLITNSNHIGFLFQQIQNLTYNNILFQGDIDGRADAGEPYVELTYIRRTKPVTCNVSRTAASPLNDTKTGISVFNNSNYYKSGKTSFIPNPANSQAVINSPNKIYRIEIYTILGAVIKQLQTDGSKAITINTTDLKPGFYSCKIITDKGIEYLKFIIQR